MEEGSAVGSNGQDRPKQRATYLTLIGFPGAHISYFNEIENYNQPFEGDYISLGQYQEQVGGGV